VSPLDVTIPNRYRPGTRCFRAQHTADTAPRCSLNNFLVTLGRLDFRSEQLRRDEAGETWQCRLDGSPYATAFDVWLRAETPQVGVTRHV
jgi:hypothetical protein